jgi:hypothetical protein
MEPIIAAVVERKSIAALATKFDIVAQDSLQGKSAMVEKQTGYLTVASITEADRRTGSQNCLALPAYTGVVRGVALETTPNLEGAEKPVVAAAVVTEMVLHQIPEDLGYPRSQKVWSTLGWRPRSRR